MNRKQLLSLTGSSGLITAIVALPAAVFANAIADAISSREPDWLFLACTVLLWLNLIQLNIVVHLRRARHAPPGQAGAAPSGAGAALVTRRPAERVSLGDLVASARRELWFHGISAKRSVTEDAFRRSLERHDDTPPRLRSLLLDPESEEFRKRAEHEREPVDSWRSDLEVTTSRLSAYKKALGIDVEMRYFSRYPIWRAIIVDRERIYVSVFPPTRRGTEADQYELSRETNDIAYGLIRDFEISWETARENRL